MAPFPAVNAIIHALAATMRGNMDDFEHAVEVLIERAGWTPEEFFAVRRGDVIVVKAEVV
jgi:hypothetical protein